MCCAYEVYVLDVYLFTQFTALLFYQHLLQSVLMCVPFFNQNFRTMRKNVHIFYLLTMPITVELSCFRKIIDDNTF